LGLTSQAEVERSPFLGALFEGVVASEILKSQINHGGREKLFYFFDQQGLEVDFLVPRPGTKLWLVEAQTTKNVHPAMASPLLNLQGSLYRKAARLILVHRRSPTTPPMTAIAKGVEALVLDEMVNELVK